MPHTCCPVYAKVDAATTLKRRIEQLTAFDGQMGLYGGYTGAIRGLYGRQLTAFDGQMGLYGGYTGAIRAVHVGYMGYRGYMGYTGGS